MIKSQDPSFKLIHLFYPKMVGTFIRTPKSDRYNQAYRVFVKIISDNRIVVLFGVSLSSEENLEDKPVAGLIVEVASEIELSNTLADVTSLKDIPLSGNMLALLFPFLREKVNYFFSNNHIQLLLNPINTIGLVNELTVGPGFELIDLRTKKNHLSEQKS